MRFAALAELAAAGGRRRLQARSSSSGWPPARAGLAGRQSPRTRS